MKQRIKIMEEDAQAFIAALETRHEAPLTWKTYATWYGNNHEVFREFGVFFYRCKNSFYFEDFERNPTMFGISLKSKRAKTPFNKYEGSFSLEEVEDTRPIPKTLAAKIIQGRRDIASVRHPNLLDKLFRQMVEMVTLKDGTVHFFELMNRKQFVNELQQSNKEE